MQLAGAHRPPAPPSAPPPAALKHAPPPLPPAHAPHQHPPAPVQQQRRPSGPGAEARYGPIASSPWSKVAGPATVYGMNR